MIKYLKKHKAQVFKTGTRAGQAPKLQNFGWEPEVQESAGQSNSDPASFLGIIRSRVRDQNCSLTQNHTGKNTVEKLIFRTKPVPSRTHRPPTLYFPIAD